MPCEVVLLNRTSQGGLQQTQKKIHYFEMQGCSTEAAVSRRRLFVIVSLAAALLPLWIAVAVAGSMLKRQRGDASKSWRQEQIEATYVGCQFREVDKTRASLTLTYDLKNISNLDYRLADGPDLVIMSKLESDGSLSQEEPVRLSYPVFLPAGQRARLAIEIARSFTWPAENDPQYVDKLRDFVKERLKDVGEFVVFDGARRLQIELPGAWQELRNTAETD